MLLFLLMGVYWGNCAVQRLTHLGAADKPTWWLLRDTGHGNPAYAQAAVDELIGRQQTGQLSVRNTRKLAGHLLDLNSKGSTQPFPLSAYHQVIEQSHDRGMLADDQWRRYWQQMFRFSLRARKAVRPGDPLPMLLDYSLQKWWSQRGYLRDINAVGLELGGIDCPVPKLLEDRSPPLEFGSGAPLPNWQRRVLGMVPLQPASPFKPGTNKVTLTLELRFVDPRNPDVEIIRTRVAVETQIVIAAPGQPSVALVAPTQHRQAVQSAIRLRTVKMAPGTDGVPRVHFALNPTITTPVPIAAQVLIRTGREEKRIAAFCNIPECRSETSGFFIFDNTPAKFDVVLRPDPSLTVESMEATEIWGEDIVIPGVTVER
ncbi:MAG: hypothetical protein ACHRHE_07780 [Tepidisphaerales bacterium]